MTYYIIFKRPEGSKCWTMVVTGSVPTYFTNAHNARDFIQSMKDIADGIDYHIAKVNLPR